MSMIKEFPGMSDVEPLIKPRMWSALDPTPPPLEAPPATAALPDSGQIPYGAPAASGSGPAASQQLPSKPAFGQGPVPQATPLKAPAQQQQASITETSVPEVQPKAEATPTQTPTPGAKRNSRGKASSKTVEKPAVEASHQKRASSRLAAVAEASTAVQEEVQAPPEATPPPGSCFCCPNG
eukprot:gene27848-7210_t